MSTVADFFRSCVRAVRDGVLIHRVSREDKEFHFQDWVRDRIADTDHHFEGSGRNTYPDFRLVHAAEGYEVKGLAYPGRELDYDSNSQVPSGLHNGRAIYYVFGRYPKEPDGNAYPLLDLVVCHGSFLNAEHEYTHRNKSVRGFGTYGDLKIRDRKMYVAPTPYGLLDGVAHHQTLILPADLGVPEGYVDVGRVERREVDALVVRYAFDLRTNELATEHVPNPHAGRVHAFRALRLAGEPGGKPVTLRARTAAADTAGEA